MRKILEKIPTDILIFATLLLGAAPFFPEPHLWEKIKMLTNGELSRPIDIFDLIMHGTPGIILVLKLALTSGKKN